LVADEFTCLSSYSDAKPEECMEMRFLKKQGPELVGAFKTPSLRNVSKTAPYMQTGQFDSLEQVIEHYDIPKPPYYNRQQHPNRPHFDILALNLKPQEKLDLIAFLHTLTSPIPEDDEWWQEPK
jgi:cytochrome c peroxidase